VSRPAAIAGLSCLVGLSLSVLACATPSYAGRVRTAGPEPRVLVLLETPDGHSWEIVGPLREEVARRCNGRRAELEGEALSTEGGRAKTGRSGEEGSNPARPSRSERPSRDREDREDGEDRENPSAPSRLQFNPPRLRVTEILSCAPL
jgi:hypothetical protein